MDYSALYNTLKTRQDVDDLVLTLDIVRDGLFKKSEDKIRSDFSKIFVIQPELIAKDNLARLRSQVLDLPIIRLVVAIVPTVAIIDKASAWVKQFVAENVVLEIAVDPSLVGGATIEFAGKFKDYSLKDKLEEQLHGL